MPAPRTQHDNGTSALALMCVLAQAAFDWILLIIRLAVFLAA